ncbi:hypothetical protein JYB62_19060 [Algoriphagus lutimaris]|nr:hypothetical protein [Algoriphagus lutimaris]
MGLILLLFSSCTDQQTPKDSQLKLPSEFFPKSKTQVLVVGTFHFDYPGLDVLKTEDKLKIDVLIEPKKSEVTELVEYIKRFKPNKVAIEASDKWKATDKLRRYKNGEFREERSESFQLGIRLATELDLDTIYAINAWSYADDMEKKDSISYKELFKDYDFQSNDPYDEYMRDWYEEEKKLISTTNLLDVFKWMNSRESHNYGYGAYLVGDFKLDDYRGADIVSMWWYNRNMRIFRNIQKITESKNDRILVIFGNGHVPILRQLLEASPEYDFVEFDSFE